MLILTALFAPLLALSAPQQATAPAKPATPAKPGTTVFHSDPMGFDYSYSSALVDQADAAATAMAEAKKEQSGVARQAVECVTLPVMAMNTDDGMRMVMLMRLDETCLGAETPASGLGAAASSILSQ